MKTMRTTLEPSESETVIHLEGPLDLKEAEFLRELLDVIAASAEMPVVIDLSQVHWIDSIGVGVLIAAEVKFHHRGRQLRLRSPRPPVDHVLELSGVTGRMLVDPEQQHP